MPGTHGDLYQEIGRLVVAADAGEALDLAATSEELSRRYSNLRVPPDMMARAIARSLSAVGISNALVKTSDRRPVEEILGLASTITVGNRAEAHSLSAEDDEQPRSASDLFPSGVRLALLS
jgi:hypothetical protein